MRALNTSATMLFGTLWAGLLVVGGVLLASTADRAAYAAMMSGGAAAVCAGGFVFQVIVADRIFPRVDRRIADVTETSLAGILIIGLGVTLLILTGGPA